MSVEKGHQNELKALSFIHRFGWLRASEIGRFMWPGSKNSERLASRLTARMEEKNLAFSRDLPDKKSLAWLLGSAGVEILAAHGISASHGKNVKFPLSWIHDIYSHQALFHLFCLAKFEGKEFKTERELRQQIGNNGKVPDALIKVGENLWMWLEVERQKKNGEALTSQTKAIVAAARMKKWDQFQLAGAIIACPVNFTNPATGHKIDHFSSNKKAIAGFINAPAKVTFLSFQVNAWHNIADCSLETVEIVPDKVSSLSKTIQIVTRRGLLDKSEEHVVSKILRKR